MSSSKLELVPVRKEDAWDEMVCRSPQGTVFSDRLYLDASGCNYHLYWVKQGSEIKAGVALVVSNDDTRCEMDDLVIYGGLMFDLDMNRPYVKRRHDEFQIAEYVIEQVTQKYVSIEFQLAPQFLDLRPFLWHEYHEHQSRGFGFDLRYTSYVDISSLQGFVGREEESPCFCNMETVRRYSVREARRKGGSVACVFDSDTIVDYYRHLMERQGEAQSSAKLSNMKKVMDVLMEAGRGAVYHVLNSKETVIYSVFYGWDTKRAYYLFGAGHPEISESWQGTLAHWEAFKDLAKRKSIREVDMEGVNSPKRGWFKLGFGGNLSPYYHVYKRELG
ncbi:MAG: GNAT family N-acetyltransferase [Gammaproteobacteria bacterium]|nr:GNAT family N-acetyltransferase [Gammaproteobacteria bacterium]